jgi:hypothetical protein
MDIMLGSSARVGECLGLRRCDVDMTTAPPTLLIDGTIVQTKAEGLHRKNAPKRTRQRRRIALPRRRGLRRASQPRRSCSRRRPVGQ